MERSESARRPIPITGWLDGRRFLGWRRPSSEMCVFEVGRALPSTIRLRGLPDGAWLMGPTPRGTALLGHADYPHFTVYEAALESGARPHRRGRFRVHDGVCGVQLLSPRADRLVAWGADEAPDGRSAASLWVFDLTRWSVRRLGCAPWRASGGADDLGLTGISWHPDGRRVSFLYDDEKGCQLYLAHV